MLIPRCWSFPDVVSFPSHWVLWTTEIWYLRGESSNKFEYCFTHPSPILYDFMSLDTLSLGSLLCCCVTSCLSRLCILPSLITVECQLSGSWRCDYIVALLWDWLSPLPYLSPPWEVPIMFLQCSQLSPLWPCHTFKGHFSLDAGTRTRVHFHTSAQHLTYSKC